jgi:hypothetical protein
MTPAHDSTPELENAVKLLKEWLTERGWSFEKSWSLFDHVDWTQKRVVINNRRSLQGQVFGMLHEIGHIMLGESDEYLARFSESHEFKNRKERAHETLRVRMSVFGEEWEAWSRGESLAKKLNLQIDYLAFRDSRNIDLKSYAEWSVNG